MTPIASERASAKTLLRVIEDLSEEHWCAGWYMSIEFHLWGAVVLWRQGRGSRYAEAAESLDQLARDADGWWHWAPKAGRVDFFPMPHWLPIFELWATPERMAWLENA